MEDFMVKLMELKDSIDYDGEIFLSNTFKRNELEIRVTWYSSGERFNYRRVFSKEDIVNSKIDLLSYFVRGANLAFYEHISGKLG